MRRGRVLAGAGLLLALGLGYAAFVSATGLFLPCLFRAATGLMCPGCGVSHMCLALLRLDLADAWAANPGLLAVLPLLAVLVLRLLVRYAAGGSPAPRGWEKPLMWGLVVWLAAWGVVRNLPL